MEPNSEHLATGSHAYQNNMGRKLTHAPPSQLKSTKDHLCQNPPSTLNSQPPTLNPERGTRNACAAGNREGCKLVREACLYQIHISHICFPTGKPKDRKLEYNLSYGSICGILRITQRTPPTSRKVVRTASVPPRERFLQTIALLIYHSPAQR